MKLCKTTTTIFLTIVALSFATNASAAKPGLYASAGLMPKKYAPINRQWSASLVVNVHREEITFAWNRPELGKRGHGEVGASFDDDGELIVDDDVPAFVFLALEGHEQFNENSLSRTVTVAPNRRLARLTDEDLGLRVSWVGYKSKRQYVRDYPQIMRADPDMRWENYETLVLGAERNDTFSVDDYEAYMGVEPEGDDDGTANDWTPPAGCRHYLDCPQPDSDN